MKLEIFCTIFIGYFIHTSNATGKEKDVHIKIHVPELIHKHSHQHTVYKKSPSGYDENEYDSNGHKSEPLVFNIDDHNHQGRYSDNQKHEYNPDKKEKKYKPKQKKSGKKKSKKQKKKKYGDDQDFKQILENYDKKPESDDGFNFDNGGFKKSVHTEHYEVKKINPNAKSPDEKYVIEGAYKVQETDPWGYPTTSFHKYDSPVSKIAASILSNYDYTNFRPEEEFSKNKEEKNHENFEDGDSNLDGYDDYGNKKKKPEKYNYPSSHEHSKHNDDYDYSSGYNNYGKPKQIQTYSSPTGYSNNDKKNKITHYSYDTPKAIDHGNDYEKSAGYEDFIHHKNAHYAAPFRAGSVQSKPKELHDKHNHKEKENIKGYSSPNSFANFQADPSKHVENLKKQPTVTHVVSPYEYERVKSELEYEFAKEFGHITDPGHSAELSEPHHDYDNDWQKHMIDYLYGQDNAASTKFVHRVSPHDRRRA